MSFSLDPITLEDWLANREIFGPDPLKTPENEQLEQAFQIETIRTAKSLGESRDVSLEIIINGLELTGFQDGDDYILVAPVSNNAPFELTLTVGNTKPRRIVIPPMDFLVIPLEKDQPLKIRAKNYKDYTVAGGKTKLITDTRGRPIKFLDGKKQQELITKIKQQLS